MKRKITRTDTREEFISRLACLDEHEAYLQRVNQDIILKKSSARATSLHTPAALFCKGPDKCPFYSACPIPGLDDQGEPEILDLEEYPVGLPCIMETTYYRQMLAQYMESLDVEPANIVEMKLVEELATLELQKHRAQLIMSDGRSRGGRDYMLVDTKTVQLEHGIAVEESTQLHPLIEMIDKLEKRRERILSKFIATRKDQLEAQSKTGSVKEQNNLVKAIADFGMYLKDFQKNRGQIKELVEVKEPEDKIV